MYRSSRSIEAGIEDDVRQALQASGIGVKSTGVPHDQWNTLANVSACHQGCMGSSVIGLSWIGLSLASVCDWSDMHLSGLCVCVIRCDQV